MKQIFLLSLLFALLSTVHVQAQRCPYSKSAEATACPHSMSAATAAAQDASIEQRFDEASGQTTYVRKEVCASSGKVAYTPVEYCSKSGRFVNVSPREKHCVKSKMVNVTARGARSAGVSGMEKVNCTTAQKAACARACGKAKASSDGASAAEAKLVKNR